MMTENKFVSLSPTEIQSIHSFMYDHIVKRHCAHRNIRIKFSNGGGGIGTVLTIKCKACNAKKDITDHDSW